MKITCGTDIIEVERIKDSIEKYGDKFLLHVFTESEIKYCDTKKNKYQHYAVRFAGKEAIYKAISEELKKDKIQWNEIEIFSNDGKKPIVNLLKKVDSVEQIDISLSHIKEYAIANCIAIIK